MFRRKNTLHLLAALILFAMTLFTILTSWEYIRCTNSQPDEFLDTPVIHKIRDVKPSQTLILMAVNIFTLVTIQPVKCGSFGVPYPDLGMSKEASTTVLRC